LVDWSRTIIKTIPGCLRDLQTSYSHRARNISILDILLVGIGLILTVAALLLTTLWQLMWRIAWKLMSFRKFPSSYFVLRIGNSGVSSRKMGNRTLYLLDMKHSSMCSLNLWQVFAAYKMSSVNYI